VSRSEGTRRILTKVYLPCRQSRTAMPRRSYYRKMTMMLGQDPRKIVRKKNRNLVMEVKEVVFNEISVNVLKNEFGI